MTRTIKTWQERLVGLDKPTDFAERGAAIAEAADLRREIRRLHGALSLLERPADGWTLNTLLHAVQAAQKAAE